MEHVNRILAYLARGDSAPQYAVVGAVLVCFACAIALFVSLFFIRAQSKPRYESSETLSSSAKSRSWRIATIGGLLSFALTLYFAYRTVYDSNLQQAETRISDQGYALLDHEMENGYIRCLYDWYAEITAEDCLKRIFAVGVKTDRDEWTRTMLYIEEVLWLFKEAREETDKYGINYFEDIRYWRDDVQPDRTGLFSFYIVKESAEEAIRNRTAPEYEAKKLIAEASLNMTLDHVCERYHFTVSHAPENFILRTSWCDHLPPAAH